MATETKIEIYHIERGIVPCWREYSRINLPRLAISIIGLPYDRHSMPHPQAR